MPACCSQVLLATACWPDVPAADVGTCGGHLPLCAVGRGWNMPALREERRARGRDKQERDRCEFRGVKCGRAADTRSISVFLDRRCGSGWGSRGMVQPGTNCAAPCGSHSWDCQHAVRGVDSLSTAEQCHRSLRLCDAYARQPTILVCASHHGRGAPPSTRSERRRASNTMLGEGRRERPHHIRIITDFGERIQSGIPGNRAGIRKGNPCTTTICRVLPGTLAFEGATKRGV